MLEMAESAVFGRFNLLQQNGSALQGDALHEKLKAAAYFMYSLIYEQVFHFNPDNHVSFPEITERVERYGNDQMKNILQFYH